jgi:hypothetical protein
VFLQQASQGTLSIMSIVSLIFDFLRAVFPHAEEAVTQQPGLVFIDELDAHMHPSWQRKIVGILRETFPAVQFFVAAHSPLVVAGCKEGEVAVLRRYEEASGFHLEQIDRHFIGATTSELYSSIFEIEEKDDTYLKYAAMYPFRSDIQKEVKEIQALVEFDSEQKREFQELVDKRRTLDHKRRLAISILRSEATGPGPKEHEALATILAEAGLEPSGGLELIRALERRLTLTHDEEARLEKLLKQQKLPEEKAKRLSRLQDDLYYIGEFERVEKGRKELRLRENETMLDLQDELTGEEKGGTLRAE